MARTDKTQTLKVKIIPSRVSRSQLDRRTILVWHCWETSSRPLHRRKDPSWGWLSASTYRICTWMGPDGNI